MAGGAFPHGMIWRHVMAGFSGRWLVTASLVGVLGSPLAALAQAGRPWVDPPPESDTKTQAPVSVPSALPAIRQRPRLLTLSRLTRLHRRKQQPRIKRSRNQLLNARRALPLSRLARLDARGGKGKSCAGAQPARRCRRHSLVAPLNGVRGLCVTDRFRKGWTRVFR